MRRCAPREARPHRLRRYAGALLAAVLLAAPAAAQERGQASATGSDSLVLNGHAYALSGISGFAFNQSCFVDGQPFACGVSATRALQTLLASSPVECTPKGEAVALCTGADGDIALSLLTQGWAVAAPGQSDAYAAAEAAARAAGAGAWRGNFLAPAAYRGMVSAIETAYAHAAGEAVRADTETALTAGALDLRGLDAPAPALVDADANAVPLAPHEIRVEAFGPAFIDAAIPPTEIFAWRMVAEALEAGRRQARDAAEAELAATIWQALAARPATMIETVDADSFHAALTRGAADWLAAGRQPLLYVMAPDLPAWIRDWFAGQPPAGAAVSRRADRDSPFYLGSIDGIDVYLGPGRERAALLVPADLLASVTLGRDAGGRVLALDEAATGPGTWLLRAAMSLDWRDDPVIWLGFPRRAAPTPDAS